MKHRSKIILLFSVLVCTTTALMAGNPDRVGQAGATELLINPWARGAGFHSLNSANVRGLEAMRSNVGGLAFVDKTEIVFARTNWLQGTGITINAFGIAQHIGESGVLGVELMAMNFGDIDITTTTLPEGGIGVFRPQFVNLAVAYSKAFSNSIYGGIVARGISEAIADVIAVGLAFDAGIQYVTGPTDNIQFGISLRNIGTPMRFGGDGLSFRGESPEGNYQLSLEQRSEKFELPTTLNIGGSYDFKFTVDHRLTVVGNFTSHSYSRDEFGAGFEYAFKEMFMIRGGYRLDTDQLEGAIRQRAETGLAAGVTFRLPLNKDEENESSAALDYSYRATNPFSGHHTIGIRIQL